MVKHISPYDAWGRKAAELCRPSCAAHLSPTQGVVTANASVVANRKFHSAHLPGKEKTEMFPIRRSSWYQRKKAKMLKTSRQGQRKISNWPDNFHLHSGADLRHSYCHHCHYTPVPNPMARSLQAASQDPNSAPWGIYTFIDRARQEPRAETLSAGCGLQAPSVTDLLDPESHGVRDQIRVLLPRAFLP